MQLKLSAARPFLRLRLRHSDVVSRHAYCIRNLHANSPTKRLENKPWKHGVSCLLAPVVKYSCRIPLPRFIPRGPLRHIPSTLLAFAILLIALPALAAEGGEVYLTQI